MKISKIKMMGVLAFLMMSVMLSAEEKPIAFSFQNKMQTKTVRIMDDDVDGGNFYDQMKATVTTKKLFAMIKARAILSYTGREDDDNEYSIGRPNGFTFKRSKFDWTIKFMPIEPLGLSFHETIWIPGTYLVVEDDNLSGGNIGSSGFTASFSGIPGLKLALTLPFDFDKDSGGINFFDKDDKYAFRIGAGAYYEYKKLFSLGIAFHEIGLDEFGFGAYATVSPLENLKFYAGYTYKNPSLYVSGDHVINFSANWTPSIMDFGLDYITNTDEDNPYFYAALRVGCNITKKFYLKVEGLAQTEYGSKDDGMFRVYPEVTIKFGKMGKLSAGMELWLDGSGFAYAEFPVTWVYSFK